MPLIRGEQITGSVASASYALTASYAQNAASVFPFSGSAVITGSLQVTGGITGSMNITNLSSGSYTQSFTNQSTWTVQHNLNSAYVVVQTYDTNEELMLPQIIDLTDANTTTISFPVALSGTAVVVVGTPLAGNGGGGNTAVSASYATNADLLDGKDSSVFAITGSNVFKGDQEITGSVTMSGGLSVGANNILIDGDATFPFIVGYGANATNNKNNTALGYFSLIYNTTGTGNVSLGGGALTNNTTGNDNTAVGSNALVSNDTGYSNVAVGYGAQGQASSPALNVAVGYQALFLGGANNVAVGYQAGRFATSTSQRNVYLGYAAGPTASLNESDKLYIANSGGVPLIGGDFSTHEVTINGNHNAGGNIIPTVSKSFSLGSIDFPWKDVFLSSGSLNIASDTPGASDTVISNVSGNILISAGGMQLLGSGSFNATTGSFQYISGSMTQVGNYTQLGDHQTTGSISISGSATLNGCSIVTSCQTSSFYTTSSFGFYGEFCSTGSQTNPVANVSRSMTLETTEYSNGVSITGGSRITVANAGAYNLQFSAQLEKTNNGVDIVYIWFKKNGNNVARSATAIDVTKSAGGGGRAVAAWNYIDTYNAGDYVEIVWQSADTAMILAADPASGNIPAIPSIIATLNQIS